VRRCWQLIVFMRFRNCFTFRGFPTISCSIGSSSVVLFVTSFLYTICASVFSTFACQSLTLLGLHQTNTVALSSLAYLCPKTDRFPCHWAKKICFLRRLLMPHPYQSGYKNSPFSPKDFSWGERSSLG